MPAHSLQGLGRFAHFAARCLSAAATAWTRPSACAAQLYQIYFAALPLAGVAGLALGVVIWTHLHGVLARFGPGNMALLPQALALAVVLELAPTGAGFIVAGRSGAGLAAELGSMQLSEQIDALEILGLQPARRLLGPRVLACMTALPLLSATIAALAIAGGFAAERLGGTMSWDEYWGESLRAVRLADLVPATLKTVVFGYLVGVTGCYFGMTARGGTEGVGRSATRGVVVSIFFVIVADAFLVSAIHALN